MSGGKGAQTTRSKPIAPLPAPPLDARALRAALCAAVLSLVGWYVVVSCTRPAPVADEGLHFPAIQALVHGDWDPVRALPMPPTYHYLAALVARAVGAELWLMRALNTLLSILTVILFQRAGQAYHADHSPYRLLHLAWNPLLLPLWVLVYTDGPALLAVVAALSFHVRGRYLAAASACLLASLIRQSNLVWVLLFPALGVAELWDAQPGIVPTRGRRSNLGVAELWDAQPAGSAGSPAARLRALSRAALRRFWPYLLILLAEISLLLHGGVFGSLPATENRPQFNIAQFYVFALTAALLWAPVWLATFVRAWRQLFERALLRPSTCALVIAAAGVLESVFRNPHPWNLAPGYLRNWVLYALTTSMAARYVTALCMVALVATLVYATRSSPGRRALVLVWAFSLLFLVPHLLVDPRYYVVPLVLVDFFTPYTPVQARRLTVWYLLLTLGIGALLVFHPGPLCGVW